jgi:hypothetical protein
VGSDDQNVIDSTAPNAPVIASHSSYQNDTNVTLSGTAEAGSTVTITTTCTTTPSSWTATANGSGNWSKSGINNPVSTLCTYSATAKDAHGNTSPVSNTVSITRCSGGESYEPDAIGDTFGDSCNDVISPTGWPSTFTENPTTATQTQTGNILDNGDAADWYVVTTSQQSSNSWNNYYFHVVLDTASQAIYDFHVYKGGCAGNSTYDCQALSGYDEFRDYAHDNLGAARGLTALPPGSSTNTASYATCSSGTTTFNRNHCDNLSSTYYIKVFRQNTTVSSCTGYTLNVSNATGTWPAF